MLLGAPYAILFLLVVDVPGFDYREDSMSDFFEFLRCCDLNSDCRMKNIGGLII